ncbi:MAG TPA: hypothetical protein VMW56_02590, partial [Candidatus Margulisiibacteriota bacterium]|nr:hypothetical protein [Candidatus Margulisiibacteriota bacterium]
PVFARAGDVDTSFGSNGGLFDPVGPRAAAHAVVIQGDGRIVVAGEASNGANQDFALVRYNSDGTRDTTFGSGGAVLTPVGSGDDSARAVAVLDGGRIVVAGESAGGSDRNFAVVRYLANGTLDTSFGSGGTVTTDFDSGDDAAVALVVQPDGKLVVAGSATVAGQQVFAVARYGTDGKLDTSFGDHGTVTTAFGAGAATANAVVLQADLKIVAGGSAQTGFPTKPGNFDFALARYSADGSLDTGFGTGGTVTTSFGSGRDAINALVLEAGDTLLAAGVSASGSNGAFAFARYALDGSLEATFKKTGTVAYPLHGQANALVLQADGKAVAAGVSSPTGLADFALMRLRKDGNLDKPTFGGKGSVLTAFPSTIAITANAVAVQADGALVAVGRSDDGTTQSFYVVRYLGDPPYTPPDTGTQTCWTKVSQNVDTLRQCALTCQIKGVLQPGAFDVLTCITACRATFDAVATKLIAKKQCPACLDALGQARLADQASEDINSRADFLYCEGTVPLSFLYINEFSVPTAGSGVAGITVGPDDNLWFTEKTAGKIGQITPAGTVSEFALSSGTAAPAGIAAGPDDNLWFTEQSANKVGRITTAGVITEYTVPAPTSGPTSIVAGPDGNLWFTGQSGNTIARLNMGFVNASPNFLFTHFVLAGGTIPSGIATGPDDNLWFTESGSGKIGRSTVLGSVTEFPIPTAASGPDTLVNGPDGALWFTEFASNKIGRIATDGSVTEFPLPTAGGGPRGIVTGADGNLWFVETTKANVGRLTPDGSFNEYVLPNPASQPLGIAATLDGRLWITEAGADKIGRIFQLGGGFVPPDANTLNCEAVVARNLGSLAKCVSKCQQKLIKANFRGQSFDVAACETTDRFKSCAAKFNAASNQLLLTTGCPLCMGATAQAALRDAVVQTLTDGQSESFCGDTLSPSP